MTSEHDSCSVVVGPTLLILYGYPGCGKLTIANTLQQCYLPHFKLFHNHLILDALLALFPYGSPSFVKYRDQLWLELIPEAIHNGDSLIFTFVPDNTISHDFLSHLKQRVEETTVVTAVSGEEEQKEVKGKCFLVEIQCEMEEILQRIPNESRRSFHKICDLSHFQQILDNGELTIPSTSSASTDSTTTNTTCGDPSIDLSGDANLANLVLNSTYTSPEENAKVIYDALQRFLTITPIHL